MWRGLVPIADCESSDESIMRRRSEAMDAGPVMRALIPRKVEAAR